MTKLCFIDTETTSLDDRTGRIWEVGLIVREDVTFGTSEGDTGGYKETEYLWQLPVCLEFADPASLRIGGYHERRYPNYDPGEFTDPSILINGTEVAQEFYDKLPDGVARVIPTDWMPLWAAKFVELTYKAHLIGNVTSFDEERLRYLLRSQHQCHGWEYHLVDVENFVAGALRLPPPWNSTELSEAVGVPVPKNQHSALGDARWAADMFDSVCEMPVEGYAADLRRGLMNERAERAKT